MKGAWQFVPQPMCTRSSSLLSILVRTLDPLIDEGRREGGCRRRQWHRKLFPCLSYACMSVFCTRSDLQLSKCSHCVCTSVHWVQDWIL